MDDMGGTKCHVRWSICIAQKELHTNPGQTGGSQLLHLSCRAPSTRLTFSTHAEIGDYAKVHSEQRLRYRCRPLQKNASCRFPGPQQTVETYCRTLPEALHSSALFSSPLPVDVDPATHGFEISASLLTQCPKSTSCSAPARMRKPLMDLPCARQHVFTSSPPAVRLQYAPPQMSLPA